MRKSSLCFWSTGLVAGLLAASLVQAETPNIQPGMWEYENKMTVDAPFPVPDQTDTHSECVTEDEIADAQNFLGDMDAEECDIIREDMRRDGANYEMVCQVEGMTMRMNMDMTFMGDTAEGLITSEADTPMGPMTSTIEMSGRRIGDCE